MSDIIKVIDIIIDSTKNKGKSIDVWVKVANQNFYQIYAISVRKNCSNGLTETSFFGPFDECVPSKSLTNNKKRLGYYYKMKEFNQENNEQESQIRRNEIFVSRKRVYALVIDRYETNTEIIHKGRSDVSQSRKLLVENRFLIFDGRVKIKNDNKYRNNFSNQIVSLFIVTPEDQSLVHKHEDSGSKTCLVLETNSLLILNWSILCDDFDLKLNSNKFYCNNLPNSHLKNQKNSNEIETQMN